MDTSMTTRGAIASITTVDIYLLDKMLIVSTAHSGCLHGNVLVVQLQQ